MTETNSQINVKPANNQPASYHTEQRYHLLLEFLHKAFAEQTYDIDSLAGDASFRRYHRVRLHTPKAEQDASYIVMDAPPQLESVESFVRVDLLMADKINVPSLIAQDIENGFLLLQDFGQVEFAHLLANVKQNNDAAKIDELYYWAMDTLLQLQTIEVDKAHSQFDIPNYDIQKLHSEMALFTDWFLPYIGINLAGKALDEFNQIWQQLTDNLITNIEKQTKVVVHRDYHSRNLMQDQYHPKSLGVIDFQDAVIGSYTYDLVSLVRDAYVDWNEQQVNHWINYFWQKLPQQHSGITLKAFTTQVNIMGVQRHLKVLGIFVRLAKRDGKQGYLKDIPKVWSDLLIELSWLVENADSDVQTVIKPFYNWLAQEVTAKYKATFLA